MMKKLALLLLMLIMGFYSFSQKVRSTGYTVRYELLSSGKTTQLTLICLIPQTREGVQQVTSIHYSKPPKKVFEKNGNTYAEFFLDSVKLKEEIAITVTMTLFDKDYFTTSQSQTILLDSTPFLIPEKYIEKQDSFIVEKALELRHKDPVKTLQQIYQFVNSQITYSGFNPESIGAAQALKSKKGDCTEFTDLFVALCRANNIPAKVIEGYTVDYGNTPYHSWPEVYLSKYGWIRLDPTPGNAISFRKLKNNYIQLSSVRNDEVLDKYHYWKYTYMGDPVKIKVDLKMRP